MSFSPRSSSSEDANNAKGKEGSDHADQLESEVDSDN